MLALSLAFGPVLALVVIVSILLMLIGPDLIERIAALVGLEGGVRPLWGWLRFPIALSLLAVVLSLIYRIRPQCQAALSLGDPRRCAGRGSVGHNLRSVSPSTWQPSRNYGVTYGSLGAAVGLLFYLYLCASVVLFGAELNAAIYRPVTNANAKGRKQ